jgi:tetratricopeptide (TPR) repeat protein
MRRDPSQKQESLVEVAALKYFTNREGAIEAFERYLNAPAGTDLRVLTFYGVGGIGKTTLISKLCDNLRHAKIPHARFDMQTIRDQTQAYREVLLQMRCDLESQFGIPFPRFDLCLAVILAREGGEPPPLVRINPILQDAFRFITSIFQAPREGLGGLIDASIRRFPKLEAYVRKVFNTEDVIHLRNLALRDDQQLYEELIRRFAEDLKENLPARAGKACRGVLFLDTYEALWSGREIHTAQGRLLDEWVRRLAEYCLGSEVLLVISGRDRLMWDEDNPDWRDWLDQHLLGGLSARDAQAFLSKCGVGSPPDEPTTPLQQAIIECCDTEPGPVVSCHPLYLALCAEIVLNTRQNEGVDPKPDVFRGIPSQQVASELANRFLKSLHNRAMELWVTELSLTPRFDETAALTLDTERQHQNGRAGWELLTHFSFVEALPNGFYRIHKTMAETLQELILPDQATTLHEWFHRHWSRREQPALAWFHRWRLNPKEALEEWREAHESALRERRISEARAMLEHWQEVALDEGERRRVGDQLWAEAHCVLGVALWRTPVAPRAPALSTAIEHFQFALQVYTEADFPADWATTQHNLGAAYALLPTENRSENLRKAIECYKNALRVRTEGELPVEWATTQSFLGNAYRNLLTGNRSENLRKAIECYKNALRVRTEADFPYEWAKTQSDLANAYRNLPTGNRGESLRKAIECYKNALRVRTEGELPVEWATTQNNLGLAYALLPTENRGESLRKAIECYKNALRVRTEGELPVEWATTQNNLGLAYTSLPTGNRREHLRQAMECYKNALRVFTETDFPVEWAVAQNNLGLAHALLPTESRRKNLHRAMECYKNALRVFTETDFPVEWAVTQNNLGLAYAMLPTGNRCENLHQAFERRKNGLQVFSETDLDVELVVTQHNLGVAYALLPIGDWVAKVTRSNLGNANRDLPTEDWTENTAKAIEYYTNALRVFTEDDFPAEWANIQRNLGLATLLRFAEIRNFQLLDSARVYFEAAARGFEAAGLNEQAAHARQILKQLESIDGS